MTGWMLLAMIVAAVVAFLLASGFVKTYRTYRGVRVITCPENLQPAAVSVAAFETAKWLAHKALPVPQAHCSWWAQPRCPARR